MTTRDGAILNRLVKRMKERGSDPLRPLIDEYLLTRDRAPERLDNHVISMAPRPRPLGRLSPSSIGGCPRAAVFRFLGVSQMRSVDPDQELMFEDGNWRHHKWQALFYDMEMVLGSHRFHVLAIEKRVVIKRLYIIGFLDAEVSIEEEDPLVVDFKGMNRRQFDWLLKQNEQRLGHGLQILPYMRARKRDKGLVLYDNKDSNHTKGFLVTTSLHGDVWDEVQEWCQRVLDKIAAEKIPNKHPECTHGSFMYETCPFRKLCYGRYDGVDLHDMAYEGFSSVDDHWRRGIAVERAAGSVR